MWGFEGRAPDVSTGGPNLGCLWRLLRDLHENYVLIVLIHWWKMYFWLLISIFNACNIELSLWYTIDDMTWYDYCMTLIWNVYNKYECVFVCEGMTSVWKVRKCAYIYCSTVDVHLKVWRCTQQTLDYWLLHGLQELPHPPGASARTMSWPELHWNKLYSSILLLQLSYLDYLDLFYHFCFLYHMYGCDELPL